MAVRYLCTLASFTAASDVWVKPSSVTLQGTVNGTDWTTIPADQYLIGYLSGQLVQRSVDDSNNIVSWTSYRDYQDLGNTAFRATYTVVDGYVETTTTNQAQTFADEDTNLITIGPDGQVLGEYIRRLVADFILAAAGGVIIDTNGIHIASGAAAPNKIQWMSGATVVASIIANGALTPPQIQITCASGEINLQVDAETNGDLLTANDVMLSLSTPAALTAHVNNWDLRHSVIQRISSNGAYNVTGIVPSGIDGEIKILKNIGGQTLTFKNESASSDAANRFTLGAGADVAVAGGGVIRLFYETATSRWCDW